MIVILDSLRYDSWMEARPGALSALGPVEGAVAMRAGPRPRTTTSSGPAPAYQPAEVYASEYYKQDFLR